MVCKLQSAFVSLLVVVVLLFQLSFASVPREICTACHKVQCSFEKPRIEDAHAWKRKGRETFLHLPFFVLQEFIRIMIINIIMTSYL